MPAPYGDNPHSSLYEAPAAPVGADAAPVGSALLDRLRRTGE